MHTVGWIAETLTDCELMTSNLTVSSLQVASGRPRTTGFRAKEGITLPVAYVYLLWGVTLTDVHRWLAVRGPQISAMHGGQAALLLLLVVLIVVKSPQFLGRGARSVWYLPLLAFLLATVISSLGLVGFAVPPVGMRQDLFIMVAPWDEAWAVIKMLAGFYILAVGTFIYLNTPRRAMFLLIMVVGQFWWWGWHSGTTGAVWWHPSFANYDGFGPLVLAGLPLCLFFGLSAQSKWYRFGGYFLGFFCAVAIVASFARGVILSAVLVLVVSLLRSPRRYRLKTSMLLLFGIGSFMLASATLFPGGFIWTEVKSAFTEGKDEGTGKDRWTLWTVAVAGWKGHPLIGVGAGQIKRVSFEQVRDGKVELDPESVYSQRPIILYYRDLHNIWIRILAEGGLVGLGIMIWMIIDFWRCNTALRRPDFAARWARATGGRFRLEIIALGFEGGMVAFVATGMFYNQLYETWFFTLLIVNRLLYLQAAPPTRLVARTHLRATGARQ